MKLNKRIVIGILFLGIWFCFGYLVRYLFPDTSAQTALLLTLTFQLFAVLIASKFTQGNKLSELGFRNFNKKILLKIPFYILGIYFFNFLYNFILIFVFKTTLPMQTDALFPLVKEIDFRLMFLLGAVVAPFIEEIFFRGFLLRESKNIVFVSIVFALVHGFITAFLPIFVISYFLSKLYEKSKSIWPSIIMHMCINGISLGLLYLASKILF